MKDDEYKCGLCGGVFNLVRNEEWNDEKARAEAERNFGMAVKDWPDGEAAQVCDDCYQRMRPDKPSKLIYETQQHLKNNKKQS